MMRKVERCKWVGFLNGVKNVDSGTKGTAACEMLIQSIGDQRIHIIEQTRSMRNEDSMDVTITLIPLLHHAAGAGCSRRVELEEPMKRESTCARVREH
jgi:hypothetical protein